jgi:hypothetical protein
MGVVSEARRSARLFQPYCSPSSSDTGLTDWRRAGVYAELVFRGRAARRAPTLRQ